MLRQLCLFYSCCNVVSFFCSCALLYSGILWSGDLTLLVVIKEKGGNGTIITTQWKGQQEAEGMIAVPITPISSISIMRIVMELPAEERGGRIQEEEEEEGITTVEEGREKEEGAMMEIVADIGTEIRELSEAQEPIPSPILLGSHRTATIQPRVALDRMPIASSLPGILSTLPPPPPPLRPVQLLPRPLLGRKPQLLSLRTRARGEQQAVL
jgi:hypothetical protein